ncbi:MAG: permease-like cell division protein FtsX [Bacteroidales bacterium]|nr:permease-like cell division protein FtsX [Bacteroidales bacterium]
MNKYPESIDRITKARLRLSVFGSVLSIALTMFFIGTLAFFAFFSYKLMHNLSEKLEMEILFYDERSGVKEVDIVAYEQQFKLENFVKESRVSSKKENTEEAKKAVGSNFLEIIDNPINASVIFSVKPEYANSDSINKIIKEIKQNRIVQDVSYPDMIVKSVHNNFLTVQISILVICIVLILISMLLIANSIRLNIYAKRFNIRSMLLVGATRGFVRRPFVFKGFVQGVWGGIIAAALLALMIFEGNVHFPMFVDFVFIREISIILAAIVVFSILYTMVVAHISVNRYIRINKDSLYL